jgi:SEC-C motif-containing protein
VDGNKLPASAVELMRARYSAHVKGKYGFVLQTTHPSTRGRHDLTKLKNWSDSVLWKKLDILATSKGSQMDNDGTVEYQAWYIDDEGLQCLRERSRFEKVADVWFYVDGSHHGLPKLEGSANCPCGSGKKYESCCG